MVQDIRVSVGNKQATVLGTEVRAGVPVQRLRKEIARVGVYRDRNGRLVNITHEMVDRWPLVFSQMRDNGSGVPIPADHSMKAEATLGNVVDMASEHWTDNKGRPQHSLFGVFEMVGQRAIELALVNGCSLFSPTEWSDGKATYHQPIVHVAITPYPVVTGMLPAAAIVASLVVEDEVKKMDWSKVNTELKLSITSDDVAPDAIIAAVRERDTKAADLQKQLDAANAKVKEVELKLSLVPQDKKPVEIDRRLAAATKQNRTLVLSSLVTGMHIPKAVADELSRVFCDDNAIVLSLQADEDDTKSSIFKAVTDALAKQKILDGNERTGAQVLELSNTGQQQGGDKTAKLMQEQADAAATRAHNGQRDFSRF